MSMNPKLERYYNYIVDEMLSKTEVNFDKWSGETVVVYYPFMNIGISYLGFVRILEGLRETFYKHYVEYVQGTYGVKTEEVKILWGKYINKVYKTFRRDDEEREGFIFQ